MILVEYPTSPATTSPTSGIKRHEDHHIRTDLWSRGREQRGVLLLARIDAGAVGQWTCSAGQANQRLRCTRWHRKRQSGAGGRGGGQSRRRCGATSGTAAGRDQGRRHRRLGIRRRWLERRDHCRCGRKSGLGRY